MKRKKDEATASGSSKDDDDNDDAHDADDDDDDDDDDGAAGGSDATGSEQQSETAKKRRRNCRSKEQSFQSKGRSQSKSQILQEGRAAQESRAQSKVCCGKHSAKRGKDETAPAKRTSKAPEDATKKKKKSEDPKAALKAKNSRKSSAYHVAKMRALKNGATLEEAKEAGKLVPRRCHSICFFCGQFHMHVSLVLPSWIGRSSIGTHPRHTGTLTDVAEIDRCCSAMSQRICFNFMGPARTCKSVFAAAFGVLSTLRRHCWGLGASKHAEHACHVIHLKNVLHLQGQTLQLWLLPNSSLLKLPIWPN